MVVIAAGMYVHMYPRTYAFVYTGNLARGGMHRDASQQRELACMYIRTYVHTYVFVYGYRSPCEAKCAA